MNVSRDHLVLKRKIRRLPEEEVNGSLRVEDETEEAIVRTEVRKRVMRDDR